MTLLELSSADKDIYNQFVMSQPTGSFLQSFEWGQWQEVLGRKVFRFWVLDDTGNRIASAQVIKMPLPLGKFYIYVPYGPVLAKGEQLQVTSYKLQEIVDALVAIFFDAVFIRIEPNLDLLPVTCHLSLLKSTNIQPAKTLVVDLQKSEEQLLAGMHSKTRYNIKLAQKHGVEIQEEFVISPGHGLYFKEAIELMVETGKRQGFVSFPESYYYKLIDTLGFNQGSDLQIHVYKALYQKQLLCSAVMIDFAQTRTFLFGGSSDFHRNVMAPYYLHYQAMIDAKRQGKNFYDFWGIETASGQTPGFVRFKLGFGGQEQSYTGAYDYIVKPLAYKIYNLGRSLNKFKRKLWH